MSDRERRVRALTKALAALCEGFPEDNSPADGIIIAIMRLLAQETQEAEVLRDGKDSSGVRV